MAGAGEDWVKVVVRKGKKRKGEAVLRDRKEEEGKGERGKGYYLAVLLQMMVKDRSVEGKLVPDLRRETDFFFKTLCVYEQGPALLSQSSIHNSEVMSFTYWLIFQA